MHWKQVGSAASAVAAFMVPWAWPEMPSALHWLVWPTVALGLFYAAFGWNKERREKGQMSLEPPLIIIGLLIVAFGVGWQAYRGRTLPSTASESAEVVAPSVPPASKRYTAYDLGVRMKTIDELSELVGRFERLRSDGQGFVDLIETGIFDNNDLKSLAENFKTANVKWHKALEQSKYQEFRDMMNEQNRIWNLGLTDHTATRLAAEIDRLQAKHGKDIDDYLENNQYLFAFKSAMKDLGLWIPRVQEHLRQRRTEYANAEPL